MARQKDLLSRLADAGEEAFQRLSEAPGADRFVGALNTMRDRVDEMQRRLLGLDALEKRVAGLEKRVDALDGGGRKPARGRAAGSRGASTRSPAAATKPAERDPGAETSGRGSRPSGSGAKAAGTRRSKPAG